LHPAVAATGAETRAHAGHPAADPAMYFFYYVPIGVDADTRRFPLFTTLFTVICVAVFAARRWLGEDAAFDVGNYVYYPGWSGPLTALAAGFLHFDTFHVLSNLVYLVLFGRYLEDRLGPALFALMFVGSTVVGNLAQGWYNLHVLETGAGIIGASGAVSGIMGAFLVRLRHHHVRVAYWVFAPLLATNRAGTAQIHVVFALALWVLIQVVRGLVQLEGSGANVAYVTHLAGFGFGVVAVILTGGWERGRVDGHLVKARRYLRRGEFYGAQDELANYAAARPDDGAAHAALARARVQCSDRDGARESYREACECLLRAGRRGEAERTFQEAARSFPDFTLAAESHLDLCYGLERNLKPTVALCAYEGFARVYRDHAEASFALLRAANLHAKQGDLARAKRCYEQIVALYPNDDWVDFAAEHARRLGTL
jgi:membrane associated rhomboid family serine protease/Tfp pilus assembly protein PilF